MGWRSASSFSALLFDLLLQFVDAPVAAHRALGARRVAPRDGFDRVGKLGFGQAAHLGDAGRQGFQLFGERFDRVFSSCVLVRLTCCASTVLGPHAPWLCDSFITLP